MEARAQALQGSCDGGRGLMGRLRWQPHLPGHAVPRRSAERRAKMTSMELPAASMSPGGWALNEKQSPSEKAHVPFPAASISSPEGQQRPGFLPRTEMKASLPPRAPWWEPQREELWALTSGHTRSGLGSEAGRRPATLEASAGLFRGFPWGRKWERAEGSYSR